MEAVERDSGAGSRGGGGAPVPAVSSAVTKQSLTGWDSQLRLQPAQLQAIAQISQRIQAHTATLYAPLKQPTFTQRPSSSTEQLEQPHSSLAAHVWLISPLNDNEPPQLAVSARPCSQSWEQQLLSTYLTSPSPAASSPSSSYSLLVASHTQLSSLVSLSSSLLSHLSLLHQHHALVHDKTNKVREECSALLAEQKELLAKADRYAANLHYYQQADRIAQQLQHTLTITNTSTSTSLDAASFPALLSSIDQCCAYLAANQSFHSSALYLAKYQRLKEKLLRLVRQYVNDTLNEAERKDRADREKERLKRTKDGAREAEASGTALVAVSSDSGRQSSWLRSFVNHRSLAPQLAPLIRDIERRAADASAKSHYASTLAEVQQLYASQRQRVVVTALSEYVANISKERELTALTRAAVSALLSLCSLESQLFDVLFSEPSRPMLAALLTNLANILYTALRPEVIRQTDIDVLCEVIVILKEECQATRQEVEERRACLDTDTEVLVRHAGRVQWKEETANTTAAASHPPAFSSVSTPSSSASSPSSALLSSSQSSSASSAESYLSVLRRLIGDCQERLSYRASVYIRDEVAGYRHTQRDVDWKARLKKLNTGTPVDGDVQGQRESEQHNGKSLKEERSVAAAEVASLVEWHPALERTLIALSKLYRCLEPNVFKILAQEAIAECLNQLTAAERLIAAQQPPQPATSAASQPAARLPSSSSAPLHATLWLIQQLLTLRSQLSPFPLDLSSPHKQLALDFSHMAHALPTLFSSSAKWSSFSDLVQLSTPRVHELRSDSKRAIDRLLRDGCERCIAQLTHHSIGALIAFFQRTAQRQQAGAGNDGQQFRAELCSIMDQLTDVERSGLAVVLSDLRRLVHAYLFDPMAERSLFTPVKRALMETAEQLRFFVNTHYAVGEGASQEDEQTAAKLHTAISTLDHLVQSIEI